MARFEREKSNCIFFLKKHDCLNFGVGLIVFSGIASTQLYTDVTGERKDKEACVPPATPTPPPQRRLAKSFSVAPAAAAAAAVSKGTPLAFLTLPMHSILFKYLLLWCPLFPFLLSQFLGVAG